MEGNILEISLKSFINFYRGILTSQDSNKPWFFKEDEIKFTLIIPETPLIIMINVQKSEIIDASPDVEKLNYEEIIQKWMEENLNRAIPFESFNQKEEILPEIINESIENISGVEDDSLPIN